MTESQPGAEAAHSPIAWGKVIDHSRCIGCHACTTACKSENEVPLSVTRTYVKYVDVGVFPQARRAFQVTRCNQCADSPCTVACPTSAMFRRPDGIVDFDKSVCVGCKACIAACPYDAIFINPEDHSAEKCNFCAHRLDVGLEPACVTVCPTEAILVGDLHDPASKVAQIVNREPVSVRRPEKGTSPKLFYKGAHQATLDPLAARRPDGGLFMWSEQGNHPNGVISGNPAGTGNSSAAALLSYDIPQHRIPWDWRVSLYTWTKGISAGVYLVALCLVLIGALPASNPLWQLLTPALAGAFLAVTGGILIWDLQHPARFYLIFTRPQWGSWLVRGAFIIAGYGAVLALHFLAGVIGITGAMYGLMVLGGPLGVLTAVYTGYLLAQAKARDLWQNSMLPPHLLIESVVAGSAILLPFAVLLAPAAVVPLLFFLGGASVIHLLMLAGEVTLTHPTAHARLAVHEMIRGRYRSFFWVGVVFSVIGCLAPFGAAHPWVGAIAAPAALVGLYLYEHAYVQAGQSVPLA